MMTVRKGAEQAHDHMDMDMEGMDHPQVSSARMWGMLIVSLIGLGIGILISILAWYFMTR